jgi:hypothetical protein
LAFHVRRAEDTMIDFSFVRNALGSAGAGFRRHAGDHAIGLLLGAGAALSVIAAGFAFAAFGGHGGGGGGGAGGGGSAGGTPGLARLGPLGQGDGQGMARRQAVQLPSDSAVAGLLQGRAAPAGQAPSVHENLPEWVPSSAGNPNEGSFDARSRPMIAFAGGLPDPMNLGNGGGYGKRGSSTSSSGGNSGGSSDGGDGGGSGGGSGGGNSGEGGSTGIDPNAGTGGHPGGLGEGGSGGGSGGGGTGGGKENPLGVVANVPEPETYALMLAGLALIGWQARRRQARASQAG